MSAHTTTSEQTLPAAALAALQQGHKIQAIKIVRLEQGLDLKQAKDVVESYLSGQPQLLQTLKAQQAEAGRSALRWLAFLLALACFSYFYWVNG